MTEVAEGKSTGKRKIKRLGRSDSYISTNGFVEGDWELGLKKSPKPKDQQNRDAKKAGRDTAYPPQPPTQATINRKADEKGGCCEEQQKLNEGSIFG